MRTVIIGDIHGCAETFRTLLERVSPGPEDRLVLLGDLFDRGPDSYGVFRDVQSLAASMGDRLVLLRGNHEDLLLSPKLTLRQRVTWNRVGLAATLRSFKDHGARMEDAIPFLRDHCQMYWRGENLQCVHAGLRKDPIEENDTNTLIHDHQVVQENRYAGPFTVVGHIALSSPTYFPGNQEPVQKIHAGEPCPLPETGILCIDTGCGKGGLLTAMIVEKGRYILDCVRERD